MLRVGVRVVMTNPADLNQEKIDAIIARETGVAPRALEQGTMKSYAVASREELIAKVARGN
jgi:hypothetical protein